MNELLCVPCQASGERSGEDRWRLAVFLIDGMSVCQDHAKQMIALMAAGPRGARGEQGDDRSQV